MNYAEESLKSTTSGAEKIEVVQRVEVKDKIDLSLAFNTGVARVKR